MNKIQNKIKEFEVKRDRLQWNNGNIYKGEIL